MKTWGYELLKRVWTLMWPKSSQANCDATRSSDPQRRMEARMKNLLEEDPSELLGLEEENDPMERSGPRTTKRNPES